MAHIYGIHGTGPELAHAVGISNLRGALLSPEALALMLVCEASLVHLGRDHAIIGRLFLPRACLVAQLAAAQAEGSRHVAQQPREAPAGKRTRIALPAVCSMRKHTRGASGPLAGTRAVPSPNARSRARIRPQRGGAAARDSEAQKGPGSRRGLATECAQCASQQRSMPQHESCARGAACARASASSTHRENVPPEVTRPVHGHGSFFFAH